MDLQARLPNQVELQVDLQSTILRVPLIADASNTVMQAIVQMSAVTNLGPSLANPPPHASLERVQRSRCVVVLEDEQVLGVVSEQDALRLVAQQAPITQLPLRQILVSPAITLQESKLTDPIAMIQFMEQHQISYLPIVDSHERLVGLVSYECLQQLTHFSQQVSSLVNQYKRINEQLQTEFVARQKAVIDLQESERRYAALEAAAPVGILHTDAKGICTYANDRYCEVLGIKPSELIGQPWHYGYHPEDQTRITQAYERSMQENRPLQIEYRVQRLDGHEVWVYGQSVGVYAAEGQVIGYVGTITDISDRKRTEVLLESQNKVLERIAKAEPLTEILNELLQTTEFHLQGTACSILLQKENHLYCAAAPSLAQSYCDAIDGVPIREGAGSCGTAGFRREIVIVSNILKDPLWRDYQIAAVTYGLRACWSAPILSSEGTLLGVFGIYYREERVPQHQDLERLQQSANIAGIAIERSQAIAALQQLNQELEHRVEERTAALQASEDRWQLAFHRSKAGIWDWDLQNNVKFYSSSWKQNRGYQDHEISNSVEEFVTRIHPDDYENLMAIMATLRSGETNFFEVEYRSSCQDGTYIWVLDRGQALRDEAGQVVRILGTEIDITDRKTAEIALKESQAQFRRLAENVPGMIYRYVLQPDGQDCFTYVSPQVAELYEVDAELVMQDPAFIWERIHPEDMPTLRAKIRKSADDLSTFVFEHRLITPSGSKFTKAISRPQLQNDGSIFWDGIVIDLTDRKRIEIQLAQSHQRYYTLIQSVNGIVWEYDLQTNCFIFVSQKAEEVLGHPISAWLNEPNFWRSHVYEADLVQVEPYFNQATQAQRNYEMEYRMIAADGSLVWVYDISSPILDDNGEVTRLSGVLIDIHDRKEAEQNLQALAERLDFALKGANIGIWEWCAHDNTLIWDHRMFSLYGIQPKDFLGHYQDWLQRVHPEDREAVQQVEQKVLRGERDGHTEFRILWPDGTVRFIESRAFNQRNDRGDVIKTIGLNLDITDRKHAEAQLHHTNEELLHATRLKDEFLANMSHELRTPLNAVLGMSEALQDEIFGTLNEQQLRSVKTIESSGNHLLALINDILDLAKIESGQITLEYQLTNIKLLCQSSLTFIKQQAFKKSINLDLQVPQQLPLVCVDERRLRQVLINLLTNAVKFTPDNGKVTLTVTTSTDSDTIEISVIDTGIGIAPQDQLRLFQPFIQIDSALNRQYSGTGLGLALVKQIVTLHNGEIRLTSEVGIGSCFMITLPCHPRPEAHLQSESESNMNSIDL